MSDSFRKHTFIKLPTSERNYEVVSIVRPIDWVLVIVFIIGLIILITWGFVGYISSRIIAQAIILPQNSKIFDANNNGNLGNLAFDNNGPVEVVAFIGVNQIKKIKIGQKALIEVADTYGIDNEKIIAQITDIAKHPISKQLINQKIGIGDTMNNLVSNPISYAVKLEFSQNVQNLNLNIGTIVNTNIEIDKQHPISLALPILKHKQ